MINESGIKKMDEKMAGSINSLKDIKDLQKQLI